MSSVAEPSCSVSDQNPEAHRLICGVRVGGLTGTILISGLSLRMTMYTYAVKTNITLPQYTFMNDTILNCEEKKQLAGKMRFCCHPFTSYVVYIGKVVCWFFV